MMMLETGPASRRGSLLLIEDQSPTMRMLARYLRNCGHLVDEATSAEDALDRLARARYDAVISDIHMPGMSGLDLMHHLLDAAPHSTVILMTGDPDDDLERSARAAGVAGYLRKPFPFVELDEVLADVFKP